MAANLLKAGPHGDPSIERLCFGGSLKETPSQTGYSRTAWTPRAWCDVMPVPEVGKPYIPGCTSIEPLVEDSFRRGRHELLLCFSQLSEDEIDAARDGKAEFGW